MSSIYFLLTILPLFLPFLANSESLTLTDTFISEHKKSTVQKHKKTHYTKGEQLIKKLRRRLNTLLTTEKQELLDIHNDHRSTTALGNTPGHPAAINMNYLRWDEGLEIVASNYAAECKWTHNSARVQDYKDLGQEYSFTVDDSLSIGENLFITSSDTLNSVNALVNGITDWYEEYEQYDYYTGDCTADCGHYTQVVWAKTRYVGCGYYECAESTPGAGDAVEGLEAYGAFANGAVIFVCNYYEAGNVVGQSAYDDGTTASSCEADTGTYIYNGMCAGCPNFEATCDDGLGRTLVSNAPTMTPSASETDRPTASPTVSTTTARPTVSPTTDEPTVGPTPEPTTPQPTTAEPTMEPTVSTTTARPTASPTTDEPTVSPTTTARPTVSPTVSTTTDEPTVSPTTTERPTVSPTVSTTTARPTVSPTVSTTTARPTASPTTDEPTVSPTTTARPTVSPTVGATTARPTVSPTVSTTTARPTVSPTVSTTTARPTVSPTVTTTTARPTLSPTTDSPTMVPTTAPTEGKTDTISPTLAPLISFNPPGDLGDGGADVVSEPTTEPTMQPTMVPTETIIADDSVTCEYEDSATFIDGNRLDRIRTSTIDECCTECINNSECEGLTYNRRRQRCRIFSDIIYTDSRGNNRRRNRNNRGDNRDTRYGIIIDS